MESASQTPSDKQIELHNHEEHTLAATDIIAIPHEVLYEGHKRLWEDKLLLVFETEFSKRSALEWVEAYNQKSEYKLNLYDELRHALFVVRIDSAPEVDNHAITVLVETRKRLLPTLATVKLYGECIRVISFDHNNRHHRCRLCFSYKHKEAHCTFAPPTGSFATTGLPPAPTKTLAPKENELDNKQSCKA